MTNKANHIANDLNKDYPERQESYLKTDRSGGLRTQGVFKSKADDFPLISVVTVVLNNARYLENTIQSVINQTYKNIEFIVIDGGSTDDKTLDIIKSNEKYIDYWISEPDKGIYDAMNKGARIARGNYIHFLNADDSFFDSELIKHMVSIILKTEPHIIFGDVFMFNRAKKFGYIRSSNVNKLYFLFKGIPQQAFFVKKELLDQLGNFDSTFKIVSDLDFLLKALAIPGIKVKYVDSYPVVVFNIGGASSNMNLLMKERNIIIKRHYGKLTRLVFTNSLFSKLICNNELRHKENWFVKLITKINTKWLIKK